MSAPTLRVVFVVASTVVPSWIAELVGGVAKANRVDVVVSPPTGAAPTQYTRLWRLYERADAALCRRPSDALDPVVLPGSIASLGEVDSCDVVVALVPGDHTTLRSAARLGVWELSHWDMSGRRSEPLGFWESLRGDLVETRLEAVGADGHRKLLYRSYGAARGASLHRARNRLLWKAKAAISSQLQLARTRGDTYLSSRSGSAGPAAEHPRVRSWHVVSQIVRAVTGVVRLRMRSLVFVEPWFIGIRQRSPGDVVQLASEPSFDRLEPPAGKAFADPFALEDDGRTFVFFEDYDDALRRAHISYVVLDGVRPTGEPSPALETGIHLSYPFVFRRGTEIYMIPESSADRTITLYRALDFPSKWVLERVLIDDISAVDATLLEHAGRLWLFAAVFEPRASPNDDLHLFSAPALDSAWEPHPGNPVVSDARSARPAGRIFRQGDEWIRPAQDCSGDYGRAIVLNRIDVLTPTEYRETPVDRIEPNWDTRLVATHTYSSTDTIELIDGRRRVLRSLRTRVGGRSGRSGGRL